MPTHLGVARSTAKKPFLPLFGHAVLFTNKNTTTILVAEVAVEGYRVFDRP